MNIGDAVRHCTAGIGIWEWASSHQGSEPDVVMACAGDVPTLETLAATAILRRSIPGLKIRVVNVVDLMKLQPASEHPHGLPDKEFDVLFTRDKPIIFAYHGYPWLIHLLTYRSANHRNLHVRGYKEEGTITTPFDMAVLNDMDRFHLARDVIKRLPQLGSRSAYLMQELRDKLIDHRQYIVTHGEIFPRSASGSGGHTRKVNRKLRRRRALRSNYVRGRLGGCRMRNPPHCTDAGSRPRESGIVPWPRWESGRRLAEQIMGISCGRHGWANKLFKSFDYDAWRGNGRPYRASLLSETNAQIVKTMSLA